MAAAYAALISLFNDLADIQNHPCHSFSFDSNQIQSLVGSVTFLIGFMESYDNYHGPSKDATQLLESQITCAALAAEEIIESHVVNQIRGGSTLDGKWRSPRFLLDLEKVIQDMDHVRRKAIMVQKARSRLEPKQPTYSAEASSSTQPLTSEKTIMVGFDDLLRQLFGLLIGNPSSRRVIPIVGTGGVESNTDTVGELGEQLHKRLFGRRYLIVLDDMWSVRAWDEMQSLFPDTNDGSRIVVTTRLSEVADHIGSSPLVISLLGDDKSWDLFCQRVFAGQGRCPPELEDVGKNIVRGCKGLPLAIVVVAGHLGKSSRMKECWENVANNIKSVFNSKENKQLFDILSFSYICLPVHLKPCFVYFGTFKEDEVFDVPVLIRQWIAEGFVKSYNPENLEEIAEDYLKDLIDRNLILDDSTTVNLKYCKIHDLLRELCLKVAEKEMFFQVVDGGRAIYRECGVASKEKKQVKNHYPLVRSLRKGRTGDEMSFNLKLCRILSASSVDEDFLKTDLLHFNLRYLHYYHYHPYFPSSISLFWNLQTLVIGFGVQHRAVTAPNEIWEMVQLRHLEVHMGVLFLDPLPSDKLDQANELVMRNLQTLFTVHNFTMSDEICKRVPNIKELELVYTDEVMSDYCPHNLVRLSKLESLKLHIFRHDSGWCEHGLTFPSSLKKLSMGGCWLHWEDITMMIGSLPHLQTLTLETVIGSEWSLVEGKFLGLKSLNINSCDDLVKWNADSSHFPVLEDLVLSSMISLEEFPSDIGAIPTLRSITLHGCSVSSAISAVKMLVEQEEEHGNEGLQLHIYFWDDEENVEMFNKKMEEKGLTPSNLYLQGRQLHA